ncbi:hypothetical protein [Thermosyntropha sp.]|uniref:hypothetical protein n=1 Tax=Thermosyntropha sp. TaxID=2740820 RepID=UPI0025E68318|nr:hypothetical protein [Thermosyntropha sp.]MBO8158297.1 hypothetical protein [Thermosyntropha sp.]
MTDNLKQFIDIVTENLVSRWEEIEQEIDKIMNRDGQPEEIVREAYLLKEEINKVKAVLKDL